MVLGGFFAGLVIEQENAVGQFGKTVGTQDFAVGKDFTFVFYNGFRAKCFLNNRIFSNLYEFVFQ